MGWVLICFVFVVVVLFCSKTTEFQISGVA